MTLINFTEDNLNFGLVASLWTVHTSRYLGQPNWRSRAHILRLSGLVLWRHVRLYKTGAAAIDQNALFISLRLAPVETKSKM